MHTKPMADSEGTFGDCEEVNATCPKCNGGPVHVRVWESSCGGYEDHQYECRGCGHYWWVEGPDS